MAMTNHLKKKLLVWCGVAMVAGGVLAGVLIFNSHGNLAGEVKTDYSFLKGKWVRPDGGYVLEIRTITKDMKLDVGYFNPRPIHVARAELSDHNGTPKLFIELRDVGYPGAVYNLEYTSQENRLEGLYYQPTHGETFNVVFVRK